ncbi:50S ribosomal protein L25 [Deltaproteobacteria bacterium OttesenSCG-928-M10]|nr:50S ribosomal protein L25 [Deltaproteobacteria bacterium OttesenSCG-928-M10]
MGLSTVLNAKTREVKSSNYAGRLRAEGFLPAVFYGPGMDAAQSVTLDYKEFKTALLGSEGNRSLYTLKIDSQAPQAVLLKDYQVDPMSRKVIHADFYKVDPAKPVTVKVPVVLTGKPVGVEKGGQLQLGAREVNVTALPDQAPAELVVDVAALNLGQSLHLSQVPMPENLKLSFTADLPVATVVAPKGVKAEAEGDDEAGK